MNSALTTSRAGYLARAADYKSTASVPFNVGAGLPEEVHEGVEIAGPQSCIQRALRCCLVL